MFAVLRSLWIWFASGMLVLLWLPAIAFVRLFDRNPLRLRTARTFRALGRAISRVNPWRLHIYGRENIDHSRNYVMVSNHQSLADIPLITHLRVDAKWMAKAELFKLPVVGWELKMAGDVPVERNDRRKAAQALLQCARYLRQGCSLMFFPEGTRTKSGEVLPFNDGPFQLALREGVPVIPLVVDGSGDALPRASWIFRGTSDIHLRVLPPVSVEGWDPKRAGDFRDHVRGLIVAELERIRAGEPAAVV